MVHVRTQPRISSLVGPVAFTGMFLWTFINHTVAADWFAPWFFGGCIAFIWIIAWVSAAVEERICQTELTRILTISAVR